MGIDTKGEVYLSLLQSNSNSKVMVIFFQQLVKQLDKDRPNWRNNTVVLIDNARYHSSESTRKTFDSLDIPVLYTGTHSYSAVACELWFAAFKSQDVNPRKLPMGKR